MSNSAINIELIEAVKTLKKKKIIRFDSDLVRLTGYSKSVVSAYLTGSKQASREFERKFEEVFKISLKSSTNRDVFLQLSQEDIIKDNLQLRALVKTLINIGL